MNDCLLAPAVLDDLYEVSGKKKRVKNIENVWMIFTTKSSARNVYVLCERNPPTMGEPQVNRAEVIESMLKHKGSSWGCVLLAGLCLRVWHEHIQRKYLERI